LLINSQCSWETYYARTLTHLSSKHQPNARPTPTADADVDSSESESEAESVDDDDDPGTSWFSEHNAPEKVLRFLTDESFPLAPCNTLPATSTKKPLSDEKRRRQPSILDLGTGNGSMLALLRKRGGFRGVMVGVDYSARSVELARELQRLKIHSAYLSETDSEEEEQEGEGGEEEEDVVVSNGAETAQAIPVPDEDKEMAIRFEEWDILNSEGQLEEEGRLDWFPYAQGGFDIVLDKGTFDAVSLSEEVVVEGKSEGKMIQRRVCERYPGIARRLVRKGGFLVVTSCNWTEEELVRWFTGEEAKGPGSDRLEVWGRVEYPKFRFGGQEGQGVCTVCFQRVD
jgi:SAM-dependent methyltransferase